MSLVVNESVEQLSLTQIIEETNLEKYINNKPLLIFLKIPTSRFRNSLENLIFQWSIKYKNIIIIKDRPESTKEHDALKYLFGPIEQTKNLEEVLGFVDKPTFDLIDRLAQKNLKISTKNDSIKVLEYTRNLPLQSSSMLVRVHLYACSNQDIEGTEKTVFASPLDFYISDFATRIEQPVDSTWKRDLKSAPPIPKPRKSVVFAHTVKKEGSNSPKQTSRNNLDNPSKPGNQFNSTWKRDLKSASTIPKPKKSDVFPVKKEGSNSSKHASPNNSDNPSKSGNQFEQSTPTLVVADTNSKEEFSQTTKEAINRNRFKYDLSKLWVKDCAALFEKIGLDLQQYLDKANVKIITKKLLKDWLYIAERLDFFNNFSELDFFLDFMSDNGLSVEFTRDEFEDFLNDCFFKEANSNMKPCIKKFLLAYALSVPKGLFLTYLNRVKKINLNMTRVFQENYAYEYFNFLAARVILNSNDYPKLQDDYAWEVEFFFYSVINGVRNCRLNDDWIRFTQHPEWLGYVKFIGGEKFIPRITYTSAKVEDK